MKKIISVILVVILLCGCAPSTAEPEQPQIHNSADSSNGESVSEIENNKVMLYLEFMSSDHWKKIAYGFSEAAKSAGLEPIVYGVEDSSGDDLAYLIKGIEEHQPSVVVVSYLSEDHYKTLKDMGLYVVVYNISAKWIDVSYERDCEYIDKFISFDPYSTGTVIADYFIEKFNEYGYEGATLSGDSTMPNAVEFLQFSGIRESIEKSRYHYGPTIHGPIGDEEIDKCKSVMDNPEVKAIYASSHSSIGTWIKAIEKTSPDDFIFVSEATMTITEDIANSEYVDGIFTYPNYEIGERCANAAYDLLNGKVFNDNEDTWWEIYEGVVATKDGEGKYSIDTYLQQNAAAIEYFS